MDTHTPHLTPNIPLVAMLLFTPSIHTHLLWCSLSHLVFLSPHSMLHHFTSLVFHPPLSIVYEPPFSMNIVSCHYSFVMNTLCVTSSCKILFWHMYHAPPPSSSSIVIQNRWHLICHDALRHPKCVCLQQCHHNIVLSQYMGATMVPFIKKV